MPRRWVAVVLSLVSLGLGHVYCGRVGRALGVFALFELLAAAAHLFFVAGPIGIATLAALPVVGLVLSSAVVLDAFRLSALPRARFTRGIRVALACAAFVLLSALADLALEALRARGLGEPHRMPSGAMRPTLEAGDHFFTNRMPYRIHDPRRGDVVVAVVGREGQAFLAADAKPGLRREEIVKRIVGVPGDEISFVGSRLFVNGRAATADEPSGELVDAEGRRLLVFAERLDGREYRIVAEPERAPPDLAPVIVEPGRYFVAGDDRARSRDSRALGTLAREDVIAPTARIYWSWDFGGSSFELLEPARLAELLSRRTRWSRIGLATNPEPST